jgi:hypothetical protein
MLPLIPLIGWAGLAASSALLAWYYKQSEADKKRYDEAVMRLLIAVARKKGLVPDDYSDEDIVNWFKADEPSRKDWQQAAMDELSMQYFQKKFAKLSEEEIGLLISRIN